MLDLLHIENIAIIEQADISFRPGFNVLTGETGAGKSIVIDALSAVLGQRASRELIRTGADHAFVSAVFSGIPQGLGQDLGIADAFPPQAGKLHEIPGVTSFGIFDAARKRKRFLYIFDRIQQRQKRTLSSRLQQSSFGRGERLYV